MPTQKRDGNGVIFRRFIRRKDGTLDDAQKHGFRAWPIRPGGRKRPRK
jgi:hypothetical protein